MLKPCNENGAVMLLVAMLASTLLLLAGLAIDSAVISNSKVQQRHAAEYMALGAIKALNKDTTLSVSDRLQNARERAQQIAHENHFLAKEFLVDKNAVETVIDNSSTATDYHGKITPGIWYFKEGTTSCDLDKDGNPSNLPTPCPCKTGSPSDWATPCFRELNPTELSIIPNATRVELRTSTNSPIQKIFSSVKGANNTIGISSSATAVQLPRRGVLLLDLSRHSHNETHIPYPIASHPAPTAYSTQGEFNHPTFSGEYSFNISNLNCPANNNNPCATTLGLANTCTFNEGNTDSLYGLTYYTVSAVWLGAGYPSRILGTTRPATLQRPSRHYKNDYSCYLSPTIIDLLPDPIKTDTTTPSNTINSLPYLIDTYYGPANPLGSIYTGPQPLNTMLEGINEAVNRLKSNLVPGDEITVIGFDGSASIDARTMGPFATNINSTEFQELENISKIELAGDPSAAIRDKHFEDRFEKHMFFPRVGNNGMEKQKNIVEALKRAKEFLISAGNDTSENYVVLLSDGLSTCYESTNSAEIAQAGTSTRCGTSSGSTLCSICSNSYAGYMNSLDQIEKIIKDEYIPNNIKFHFLQIGNRGAPHNVQRVKEKGGIKTCMTIKEMEAANPPLDTFNTTFVLTPGNAEEDEYKRITYGEIGFPPALELAKLAKESKGKYVPIRPQCLAGGDVTAALNTECENLANQAGSQDGQLLTGGAYSDANGRVFCEPENRDRSEQMRDAIAEVFNEDPYIIVD